MNRRGFWYRLFAGAVSLAGSRLRSAPLRRLDQEEDMHRIVQELGGVVFVSDETHRLFVCGRYAGAVRIVAYKDRNGRRLELHRDLESWRPT